MKALLGAHSGLRWVVLILLIYVIVNAFNKRKSGTYSAKDKMLSAIAMGFTHLQIVLGLIIYFAGGHIKGLSEMSVAKLRFISLEHPLMMIFGAVLITLGHIKAKKAGGPKRAYFYTYTFFGIGLLIILSRIPWPFLVEGAGWF